MAPTAVLPNGDVEAGKEMPRDTGKDHLEHLTKRYGDALRVYQGGLPAKATGKDHSHD